MNWGEVIPFELLVVGSFGNFGWFMFWPAVNATCLRAHNAGKPSHRNGACFAITAGLGRNGIIGG